MSEIMSCGHPVGCLSEMQPDFIGDTPATQRIGTVYCRWCEDRARLVEARRALVWLDYHSEEPTWPEWVRNACMAAAREGGEKGGGK